MITQNKLSRLLSVLLMAAALCASAFGQQTALTSTTLTVGVPAGFPTGGGNQQNVTTVSVASATGISGPQLPSAQGGLGSATSGTYTFLYVDRELMQVNSVSGTNISVGRGVQGTAATAHNSGATVYVVSGSQLITNPMGPQGGCNSAINPPVVPYINPADGTFYSCPSSGPFANVWTKEGNVEPFVTTNNAVWVAPSSCAWSTTGTTTGTNGNTNTGASAVPTNQVSVSAAGASVNTLTCSFSGQQFRNSTATQTLGRGTNITSIDVTYGVQTTALTSINGAAVSTITFPTPAASETASTVTPVAITPTIAQSSTTGNLATTTAGSFRTSRLTLSSPLALNTDDQIVLVTEAFNQSASAAQIVNTMGILVHFQQVSQP